MRVQCSTQRGGRHDNNIRPTPLSTAVLRNFLDQLPPICHGLPQPPSLPTLDCLPSGHMSLWVRLPTLSRLPAGTQIRSWSSGTSLRRFDSQLCHLPRQPQAESFILRLGLCLRKKGIIIVPNFIELFKQAT